MNPDLSNDDRERVQAGAAALRKSLEADAEAEHPQHDQIAAYVDGAVGEVDREVIMAHLDLCATCAQDVEDLRRMRDPASQVFLLPTRKRMRLSFALAAAAALVAFVVWIERVPPPSPVNTANVEPDTPETRLISTALRTGLIDIPPEIAALRGTPGTLLGAAGTGPSFTPVRPLGTAVDVVQPPFEWTAQAEAESYTVSVFDTDLNRVAESGPVAGLQWMPAQPLQRDRTYVWQIRATTPKGEIISPAPPAPEARFRVLAQAEADRVAAARSTYASSPLSLGILLADAGLIDEAEQRIEEAVRANPSSQEAQQLLTSIKSRRQ